MPCQNEVSGPISGMTCSPMCGQSPHVYREHVLRKVFAGILTFTPAGRHATRDVDLFIRSYLFCYQDTLGVTASAINHNPELRATRTSSDGIPSSNMKTHHALYIEMAFRKSEPA